MKDQKPTHKTQKEIWDREHQQPFMFPFVDSVVPNPGVVQFWDWLRSRGIVHPLRGLEICCGKGRNTIWLAGKGVEMAAFDFSESAIQEAKRRQERMSLRNKVSFTVSDALAPWPYPDHGFDFVVDCFGSSDIESEAGRNNVLAETLRVLKPGGFYSLQIDTAEMGFFAERFREAPGPERNTLIFPNGKVESVLSEDDIQGWQNPLALVEVRREIETALEIYGQTEPYKYFWIVAQAPTDCGWQRK